ncbi:hypothetical protein ERJ75_000880400 [Trypanosoma vivax]|uniref:Uncharacterized protein n=1 Tax=Trypanosoma vivax (strain Y486) TaxID=1055687 RepID=G0TRC6_TRYVY|nr:hypothetical protein TRVL_06661 [Trypanosoma vivax]KAH8612632.1 hypothetical protein ERJ75_000880400 [Trypanosoma vivax]CCC46490.1 conserved hypothetical protein [Trypanosoma vivax Y486]
MSTSAWASGNFIEKLKQQKAKASTNAAAEAAPVAISSKTGTNGKLPPHGAAVKSSSALMPHAKGNEGLPTQNTVPPAPEKQKQPGDTKLSDRASIVLPHDAAEVDPEEFTFVGMIEGETWVEEEKKTNHVVSSSSPATATHSTEAAPLSSAGWGVQRVGEVPSVGPPPPPPHHHHCHCQYQMHHREHDHFAMHQQWHGGHLCHYRRYPQSQYLQRYMRPDAAGKMYHGSYNPSGYSMSPYAMPYYPRMYNRYPGMHMEGAMYPGMGGMGGFSLQKQPAYYPPPHNHGGQYALPHHNPHQLQYIRAEGMASHGRKTDCAQWCHNDSSSLINFMKIWRQKQSGDRAKHPEGNGSQIANTKPPS